jgi:lysophospholipase L1-like esterase
MPVPSGLRFYGLDPDEPGYGELLNPDEPGYVGSFLNNMQQIIDVVVADGKIPILAKVPITLGPCSICTPFSNPDEAARNILIRDYNTVIDELVAANGIVINPPNFYDYFRANQDQFSDNLHFNGKGYQSMADLWFDALRP